MRSPTTARAQEQRRRACQPATSAAHAPVRHAVAMTAVLSVHDLLHHRSGWLHPSSASSRATCLGTSPRLRQPPLDPSPPPSPLPSPPPSPSLKRLPPTLPHRCHLRRRRRSASARTSVATATNRRHHCHHDAPPPLPAAATSRRATSCRATSRARHQPPWALRGPLDASCVCSCLGEAPRTLTVACSPRMLC